MPWICAFAGATHSLMLWCTHSRSVHLSLTEAVITRSRYPYLLLVTIYICPFAIVTTNHVVVLAITYRCLLVRALNIATTYTDDLCTCSRYPLIDVLVYVFSLFLLPLIITDA